MKKNLVRTILAAFIKDQDIIFMAFMLVRCFQHLLHSLFKDQYCFIFS